MSDETRTITYGETTFTRTSLGRARGYTWTGPKWTGPKWKCDICGRDGYGDSLIPGEWASTCARGHAECPWCGRSVAVCIDGAARVHNRCKSRPEHVADDWDAAKELHTETRAVVAEGVSA